VPTQVARRDTGFSGDAGPRPAARERAGRAPRPVAVDLTGWRIADRLKRIARCCPTLIPNAVDAVTGIGPWQRLASLAIEAVSLLALPGYGQLDVTDHTRGLEPGELAFCELLRLGRLSAPERLPDAAAAAAKHFGGRDVEMLLVDHGQVVLVPFGFAEPPVRIEGSVAGRAFCQVDVQEISVPGGRRLWLPLLDGVDRLGVLGVTFSELDELTRLRADRFAALLAEILLRQMLRNLELAAKCLQTRGFLWGTPRAEVSRN